MTEEKYCVRLEHFEGPLDLLLHLLEVNKMDIYDIPIAEITRQYLAYLSQAEEMNLEIASEFLVMAATLLGIKARMLLPKPPKEVEEESDPRAELANRLLEYKFYKEASERLRAESLEAGQRIFKPVDVEQLSKEFAPDNPVSDIPLSRLWEAFGEVLRHQAEEKPTLILTKESYDVEDMIAFIRAHLEAQSAVEFASLFADCGNRPMVIAVFLALLELFKTGEIILRQAENFDTLWIIRAVPEEE